MSVESTLLPAFWNPYVLAMVAAGAVVAFLVGLWAILAVVVRTFMRVITWLSTRTSRVGSTITPIASLQVVTESSQAETDEPAAAEAPEAEDQPISRGRRRFLTAISLAVGGVGAAIIGVPVIGVLFAPLWREKPAVWRPVGRVDEFAIGDTVQIAIRDPDPLPWAGFAAETPAWLRRETDGEFIVFSAYCTHVGCPVRWEADADLFMCPCHGGVFYRNGTVAAGPPPRPLDLFEVRIENGVVQVSSPQAPLPATDAHVRPTKSGHA